MFTIFAVSGVLALVALVMNRRAVGRIYLAAQGGLGSLGRKVAAVNPIAQRQEELDNCADEIEGARKGLEEVEVLALSLNRQIQDDLKEKTKLENRISRAISKGDTNKAKEYALRLEAVERSLAENQVQYNGARKIYDNYVLVIKRGESNLEERYRTARQQNAQVQITGRIKAVLEHAKAFDPNTFGTKLDKAEQAVLEQLDKNQAAINVAADLSSAAAADLADDEEERDERARVILSRFTALPAPAQEQITQVQVPYAQEQIAQ